MCHVRPWRTNHHWATARRAALARDGHACARCGITTALHVHHVVPCGGNRADGCQHHQANLLTLCATHHRQEHDWLRDDRPQQLVLAA